MLRVDVERASALAIGAEGDFELLRRVLEERTESCSTFAAVEFDVFELREDTRSTSDDSGHFDETIEISLTKVAQRQRSGKFGDSDVDLRVDSIVRRVVEQNGVESDFIEKRKQRLRGVGQEVREDRSRRC